MGKDTSYLLSGASRGVGLDMVKLLLSEHEGIVIGGARNPDKYEELQELKKKYKDRFHILKLDISDSKSVQASAKEVEKLLPDGLDYLFNNAGTSEDIEPPSDTPDDQLTQVMQTNAIVYKASKAAVNMVTLVISNDKREEGWTVISVHPGIASTDMGNRPQEYGEEFKPECTPEESAKGLLKVIHSLTPKDTGSFRTFKGDSLPW
ncbi:hypothetical protein WJX73_007175 [Symbiochloris irregularis]|uniref:Uncharacterized protein n=1 Tax=Symbiochloris irregularis TaxID=706552 RepID=A0AAW1Q2J3_9CHLO